MMLVNISYIIFTLYIYIYILQLEHSEAGHDLTNSKRKCKLGSQSGVEDFCANVLRSLLINVSSSSSNAITSTDITDSRDSRIKYILF